MSPASEVMPTFETVVRVAPAGMRQVHLLAGPQLALCGEPLPSDDDWRPMGVLYTSDEMIRGLAADACIRCVALAHAESTYGALAPRPDSQS